MATFSNYRIVPEEPDPVQTYEYILEKEQELRLEVQQNQYATLQMLRGSAEVFGTELNMRKEYNFGSGAKIAVFSWHGCSLMVSGRFDMAYIAGDTPMRMYVNTHAAINQMREKAVATSTRGPCVMIVGPMDVGKSTLCRILLNYAVRMDQHPIFADLDVGQGQVAVPGTVGAVLVEQPADPTDTFNMAAPVVYTFGHVTPSANKKLYELLITQLAETVSLRSKANNKASAAGIIVNTCGWVKEYGYKALTHAAQGFEVDVILVLDSERLYNELRQDIPSFVKVLLLPKSGGVLSRERDARIASRINRVHEYFYGFQTPLYPYSFEVPFSEVKLFRLGGKELPSSLLPLGTKQEDLSTKAIPLLPNEKSLHHMLAVSMVESTSDDIVTKNVAGFVVVTAVNMEKERLTLLSPSAPPLPSNVLIFTDIQYMEMT